MRTLNRFKTVLAGATLALLLAVPAAAISSGGGGGGGGTALSATLSGTDNDPFANGLATFRNHGHVTVLEVDVQDVTYSDDVVVLLDGVPITEIFLTGGVGQTELEVEVRGGVVYYQPPVGNPIPVQAGTEIDVVDATDGAVLLVGVFG
jgi:hypothetical protein